MVASDSVFAGSIPALYEKLMVPLLFEPYALDLARRAAGLRPGDILETAAGTGVVTRALAAVLPQEARISATDLNPAMLDVAKAGISGDRRISWRPADALSLPFADDSFDLVICQFGVMFFPDKAQGYREAHRVLRPGGHFLFNVWDGLSGNGVARVVAEAMAEVFPENPPRFVERTPYGYHDMTLIGRQLAIAGFQDVTTEAVAGVSRGGSAMSVATAICQGTPLRAEIEARGGSLTEVTEFAAGALTEAFGTGALAAPMRAFVVLAKA